MIAHRLARSQDGSMVLTITVSGEAEVSAFVKCIAQAPGRLHRLGADLALDVWRFETRTVKPTKP